MNFTIIAAVTANNGIGTDSNELPWKKFASDMKWFRQTTLNNTVIMGRKTFESLGNKPLPNRNNIVVSSSLLGDDKVTVCSSLGLALKLIEDHKDVYVIGGSKLYQEAINHPRCTRILLTRTNLNIPCNTFFPNIDQFYLSRIIRDGVETITLENDKTTEIKYEFCEYLRCDNSDSVNKPFTPSLVYKNEQGYLQALRDIMTHGVERADRTGVGTHALFGLTFRYDLSQGYPLLTTKKMFTKAIIEELLWFLRGQTDAKILQAKGIKIWDGNTSRDYLDSRGLYTREEGDIGPGYGFQFRHAGAVYFGCQADYTGKGTDQVQYVLDMIKNNPTSRKIVINLWNAADLSKMALEPCHMVYQFWVTNDQRLSCSLYQRSGDMGLGVPFNIASASLMTHIFAKLSGLGVGELVHTIGDAHIYKNHLTPLKEQITRNPEPFPILTIQDRNQQKVEDFVYEDFTIKGYYPHKPLQMNMAV